MLRWKVRLAGERSEIEDLRLLVDLPEFRISDENNEYFLDSESFNGLTDAGAVRERAERLITVANGVVRSLSGRLSGVKIGGLASIGPDGKSTQYIFIPSIQSTVRFGMGGKVFHEGQHPALLPSTPQRWIELALRDETVARALTYYARHLNPTSLYKVFETIRMDVGGEGQIVKKGWASRNRVSDFRQTLQSEGDDARHAEGSCPSPSTPLTESECTGFVRDLLHRWIADKLSSGSTK